MCLGVCVHITVKTHQSWGRNLRNTNSNGSMKIDAVTVRLPTWKSKKCTPAVTTDGQAVTERQQYRRLIKNFKEMFCSHLKTWDQYRSWIKGREYVYNSVQCLLWYLLLMFPGGQKWMTLFDRPKPVTQCAVQGQIADGWLETKTS